MCDKIDSSYEHKNVPKGQNCQFPIMVLNFDTSDYIYINQQDISWYLCT